jgi:hypothetical protein
MALHPTSGQLHSEYRIPPQFPGFSPARHAVLADFRYAGAAAFNQEPYTPVDDVQGLLLVGCSLWGAPAPWHAEAEARNYVQVSLWRASVFAGAEPGHKDPVNAAAFGDWLAELPPVLKRLAQWALPRTTATVADLKGLQAMLQVHDVLNQVPSSHLVAMQV